MKFIGILIVIDTDMDALTEMMTEALIWSGELGILEAETKWIECIDADRKSKNAKDLCRKIELIKEKIKKTLRNIDSLTTDAELTQIENECTNTKYTAKLQREMEIERKHRPKNVIYDTNKRKISYGPMNYNKKALINMTQCSIPEDISIGLSFGWRFLFPFVVSNRNLYEVLAQIDSCMEEIVGESMQVEASMEISRALMKRQIFQYDDTQQWLRFISRRTKEFFLENNEIFPTRSDKGAHTVVIQNKEYDKAIEELLSGNEYDVMCHNPIEFLRNKETQLMNILKKNYKSKQLTSGFRGFAPNTLNLAKFYGLPKIHKPGFKLRPIVSMIGAPGHAVGRIFNEMLKEVFPITKHHVRDSFNIKEFLDGVEIPPDYVLRSFDVVSMFSNIPTDLAGGIIMEEHEKFYRKFGIGKKILFDIMNFLLNECTIFTAIGKIFKQKEGLPMGGCISPTIARLVMDRIVDKLYREIPDIAFIKVFVDDTLAVIDPNSSDLALQVLNNFHPKMSFTMEKENENGSINFLNLNVIRRGNQIKTNWYRKLFASGRLVSYYSSHKRSTVLATAETFIKTTILLSDGEFFHQNRQRIIDTLKDNCFPDTVIETLMNRHYTLMKPMKGIDRRLRRNTKYKIFPHSLCKSKEIREIFLKLTRRNFTLADSTKNTEVGSITTRKTKTPWGDRSNVILISRCVCKQKYKVHATQHNETASMTAEKLVTTFGKCDGTKHAFKTVKFHRGLSYVKQTKFLVKYIKYFYNGRLINTGYDLPNYHLSKVLKGVKIPPSIKKLFE